MNLTQNTVEITTIKVDDATAIKVMDKTNKHSNSVVSDKFTKHQQKKVFSRAAVIHSCFHHHFTMTMMMMMPTDD